MLYYLLYIGKSNKKFTHNKVYNFMGSPSQFLGDVTNYMNITIYANDRLVIFHKQHFQYFKQNFKLINDKQLKQLERKKKLIKISK